MCCCWIACVHSFRSGSVAAQRAVEARSNVHSSRLAVTGLSSFTGAPLPAYGGRKRPSGQPPSNIHNLSVSGTENPSSRFHPLQFCLSTRGRVGPYKTEKEMLPEPFFLTSQNPPLNETNKTLVLIY